jgi:hypothetical protein
MRPVSQGPLAVARLPTTWRALDADLRLFLQFCDRAAPSSLTATRAPHRLQPTMTPDSSSGRQPMIGRRKPAIAVVWTVDVLWQGVLRKALSQSRWCSSSA